MGWVILNSRTWGGGGGAGVCHKDQPQSFTALLKYVIKISFKQTSFDEFQTYQDSCPLTPLEKLVMGFYVLWGYQRAHHMT